MSDRREGHAAMTTQKVTESGQSHAGTDRAGRRRHADAGAGPRAATCPARGHRRGRRRSSTPAARCSATPSPGTAPHRRRRPVRGAHPPGRGRHLRLPRRRDPAALRRLGRLPQSSRHVLVRHEQGAAHAADGYARASGGSASASAPVRPRRHQPRHRHRHRPARLRAHRRHHRQRARRAHRQGRLPGDRHHRHHAADDQAQLPGPQRRRHPARHRRGLPHRAHRAPGPGPRRHHQGRPDQRDAGAATPTRSTCPASSPRFEGHPRQIRIAAEEIDAGPAAAHPGRPRRPHRRRHRRAARPSPRRPRSRSPTRSWASAPSTSGTRCRYGYMGMHGWKHVNRAIQSADLLIALGMRFDDRVTGKVSTYAPNARIVHVDIDPSEIGKNVAVDVPIVGDVGRVLRALIAAVPAGRPGRAGRLLRAAGRVARATPRPRHWHGSGGWRQGLLSADYVIEPPRRADGPRRHPRRRRGPAPDVAGPLRRLPAARQPPLVGRPGHDGLRPPGGHGRGAGPARQGDLGGGRRRRPPDDQPGDAHRASSTASPSRSRSWTTRSWA